MTLEADLQSAIAGVAPAFQDVAVQNTQAPYIVWQNIVSTTNNSMNGASNVQNTRIQVDCYAATAAKRKTMVLAVIAAMAGASFSSVQISGQNLYESDTRLFRGMLDFSVWSAG